MRRFFAKWFQIPCVAHCNNGASYYLSRDPLDDVIVTDLLGAYGDLFFPLDISEIPENAWILDLGSHHGAYAVTALLRYPTAQVIAVEPDPNALNLLRKNIELNSLKDRIEIVDAAIGAQDGEAMLEQSIEGSWGNRVITKPGASPVVRIKTLCLTSILRSRRPYLIKCNCEGGEFTLIPQMLSMGLRPRFIILFLHPEEGDSNALLDMLTQVGYQATATHSSATHPRYVCRRVY
jgi:FkbM family methyltransferase